MALSKKVQRNIILLRKSLVKAKNKKNPILSFSIFLKLYFLILLRAFLRACAFLFDDDNKYFFVLNGEEKRKLFFTAGSYCVYRRFQKKTIGFGRAAMAVILIASIIGSSSLYLLMDILRPGNSTYPTEAAGESWYNAGWSYRKQITIDHTKVDDVADPSATYANFPVLISLDSLSNINADGTDVRFTSSDGVTELPREIERYSSGSLRAWVKITLTKDSSDSTDDIIYMYYGNAGATEPAADSAYGLQNVWKTDGVDTSAKMVQHLNEAPANDVAGHLDSTSNANHGTPKNFDGTATSTTDGEGKIDGADVFDGLDDYVNITNNSSLNFGTGDFTFSAWIKTAQDCTGNKVYAGEYQGSGNVSIWLGCKNLSGVGKAFFSVRDSLGNSGPSGESVKTINDNQWHHLVGAKNGSNTIIYVDGIRENSGTGSFTGNFNATADFTIGAFGGSFYTEGTIDEVRIYNRALSAEEIATQYNNANSPSIFYTFSAEEYFDHLAITGADSMSAGGSQVITITAKTNLGNTYDAYTGDKSLTFSGASVSGEGNNPTCSDKTSADINFGTAATITFASGIATCVMKLYKAESAAINATDGTKTADGYTLSVSVGSLLSGTGIQINSNDAYTISKDTTLTLSATGASQMKFSNDNNTYSSWEAYGASKDWDITNATYGGTSSDGAKTVYAKYKDSFGNESSEVNDNIVYDTTSPVNPTSAIDSQGAVTDTWQNNKNDPNFTSFTGASDANGIAGFYVYFGADSAGANTDNWSATDAYDPASFSTSNTRYLRVLAKDNAGLYADPDGAGDSCDNTNDNRPADPDCWSTIFIHKYDIDAPNTPSPASSPLSWTNANSFDFSWSDPGDIGGSGVYNYTYFTDAGISSTDTASTSVNSLTSDAVGTKTFSVKANDNAGNSGSNGTANFYYDNTAPLNAGTATDGNGSLDDTWGIVSDPSFTWVAGTDAGDQSGVKEYDVYWGADPDGTDITATVVANAYDPGAIAANTPYYLRLRTRDNALNQSAWETKFTMKYSQSPASPSALSQTANAESLTFGAWTTDTAPTLNFTLSDPDSDTLGYTIKIDGDSDFSSPEVFYTYSANDLISGAEASFTIGQAEGSGTYTTGNEGQTLADGQYYWKVQAIESHGLASGEVSANSGQIALGIDTAAPAGAALDFGAIANTSIAVAVSGAADSGSGLNNTPYWFENTTNSDNSGWQAQTSWTSGSLTPNTQYAFRVKTRDALGNESAFTAAQSRYTLGNMPSSLSLAADSSAQITASWSANSNPEGTQYYAQNITAGTSSEWINAASWSSTNLTCGASYSFRVKARNNENTETAFGDSASLTTPGCGGALPPVAYNPPAPPAPSSTDAEAGFKISINDGASQANAQNVILGFTVGVDTARMAISNTSDFSGAIQEPYQSSKSWILSPGDGIKTVYAKFYTQYGAASETVSASIVLDTSLPIISSPSLLPSPGDPETADQPSPETSLSRETTSSAEIIPSSKATPLPYFETPPDKPAPVNPNWNLIDSPKMEEFFPQANEVPFFTEKFSFLLEAFKNLIDLSAKLKDQIPSEIYFVSDVSGKINLDSFLALDEGSLKQKISAPSSTNLSIAVKPDQPARSISGYLALKKSAYSYEKISNDEFLISNQIPNSNGQNLSVGHLNIGNSLGQLGIRLIRNLESIFTSTSFASASTEATADKQIIEQRFVLAQFQYTDPDKDGIWTADIQTPAVAGEYEIISLISYEDSSVPPKEIRLIAVIDPEGYVYERIKNQELRIKKAIVSICWLNPQTDQYELWPAEDYNQKNPQTTDATGKYSFLVPSGSYYLKAEAPGYASWQGEPFDVAEGKGVHINIELKAEFNLFSDWKTIAIAGLAIIALALAYFLAYNFYEDKRRKV